MIRACSAHGGDEKCVKNFYGKVRGEETTRKPQA
jgi:hypothetical protein